MKFDFDVDGFINRFKNNCRITDIKEFQANEVITTFLPKRNQFRFTEEVHGVSLS